MSLLHKLLVNNVPIAGTSFRMPASDVTVSAEFVENVPPTDIDNKYLNEQGLAKVISLAKTGLLQIFTGTRAEWDALSNSEKNKYDMAEVVN